MHCNSLILLSRMRNRNLATHPKYCEVQMQNSDADMSAETLLPTSGLIPSNQITGLDKFGGGGF